MIIELGHYALVLALATAIIQGVLPVLGVRRGDPSLMGLAANARSSASCSSLSPSPC